MDQNPLPPVGSPMDDKIRSVMERVELLPDLEELEAEFDSATGKHRDGFFACTFADLSGLVELAAAERVTIDDNPETQWFGLWRDGAVVACAAVTKLSPERWQLRGAFTVLEFRGQGAGEELLERRVRYAIEQGATSLLTYSYKPLYFLDRGWTNTGEVRVSGAMALEHTDLQRCLEPLWVREFWQRMNTPYFGNLNLRYDDEFDIHYARLDGRKIEGIKSARDAWRYLFGTEMPKDDMVEEYGNGSYIITQYPNGAFGYTDIGGDWDFYWPALRYELTFKRKRETYEVIRTLVVDLNAPYPVFDQMEEELRIAHTEAREAITVLRQMAMKTPGRSFERSDCGGFPLVLAVPDRGRELGEGFSIFYRHHSWHYETRIGATQAGDTGLMAWVKGRSVPAATL